MIGLKKHGMMGIGLYLLKGCGTIADGNQRILSPFVTVFVVNVVAVSVLMLIFLSLF